MVTRTSRKPEINLNVFGWETKANNILRKINYNNNNKVLFVGIGLCSLVSIASLFTIVDKKNLTQVAIFYSIVSLLEI